MTPRPIESTIQSAIIDALRKIGCDVMVHSAATKAGRRTGPSPGFPKGFPDMMVLDQGPGRVGLLFAEVKRDERENLRPEQRVIHDRLIRGGAIVLVWWSAIQAVHDVIKLRANVHRRHIARCFGQL